MQHGVGGLVASQRLLRQVLVTLCQALQLSKPTGNSRDKCQQQVQVSTEHTQKCQQHTYTQVSTAHIHTSVNSTHKCQQHTHKNVNSTHTHKYQQHTYTQVSTAHTSVKRNIEHQQEQFMAQETMSGNRNDEEQLEVTNGNNKFKCQQESEECQQKHKSATGRVVGVCTWH